MDISRKNFFIGSAALVAAAGLKAAAPTSVGKLQGFDETVEGKTDGPWQPFSDKKVRVGIAGYGVCTFGAMFFFQDHPNVEVVAATDLDPERCARLAQVVGAKRTYPSAEEMIDKEGKNMDAVFIATDAASHADLVLRALDRGYHVCSAVPALLGERQLDRAPKMIEAVKKSGGLVYALFETTAFRPQAIAMRRIYEAGGFGRLAYTEGEYFHHSVGKGSIGSYKGWRIGLPPQYYPTHSNGFYTCVTHGHFTEVTCVGTPDENPIYKERKNPYGNPFSSEVAFFKTSDGGSARMTVAWGLPGYSGELGRCFGTLGCFRDDRFAGNYSIVKNLKLVRAGLPPGMKNNGHHGGSHPYLTDDFLRAILVPGHKICVDVATALNTTVSGVYAHISAMKGGETLKIPVFSLS
ncbi:MAG: Gfo/Idh/MocA family oxidoreductase [Kiritimatiellae bacterium]|nr:Gfo/Idh/MocA family oxidoreductase [Kiritimatiellia bacterium]